MKVGLSLVATLAMATLTLNAATDFHAHVGIQLWSLRDTTKTSGLPASLDLIKGFGFTEVEGGIGVGDMTAVQVRAAMDARGLTTPALHAPYELLGKDIDSVIRDAKTLGAEYIFCPWIPHEGAFDVALLHKVTADFNKWGAAIRAAGLKFGYHPHGYEFVPTATPGETLLDELIRGTNPADVSFEMDVFWIIHGGGTPVKLLEKYPTRWVALHVKDMRKGAPSGFTTAHAPDTDNVAVGDGLVDWKAVIGTAQKVGVKYYFVEDETPNPMQCIPASFAYLKTLKP